MGFYPFAPLVPSGALLASALSGQTIPGNFTVSPGNLTVSGSISAGSSPGGPLPEIVAATAVAGFSLVNSTPTILTWTAPADGKQHRVTVFATMHVTVTQTGGQVVLNATAPDGTAFSAQVLYPSAQAAGAPGAPNVYTLVVEAGATVTVVQAVAMSAGTAVLWAEIWAS